MYICSSCNWFDAVAATGSQQSTERKLRLTGSKPCRWKIPFESVSYVWLDRSNRDFRCIGCIEPTKEPSHNGRKLGTASTQNCKMDHFVLDKCLLLAFSILFEFSRNFLSCMLLFCLHRASHVLEDARDFRSKGNVPSAEKTRHFGFVWDRLIMTCPPATVKQSWERSSGLRLFGFCNVTFLEPTIDSIFLNVFRLVRVACKTNNIKAADLSPFIRSTWLKDSIGRKVWDKVWLESIFPGRK